MSIVVLGATGMLGSSWIKFLQKKSIDFVGLSHDQFDIQDPFLFNTPEIIINCAGYTKVDLAERNEVLATAVNGIAVGRLARYCKDNNVKLINYSTDYIFDGKDRHPYSVHHERSPLNAYGRSKLVGEVFLEISNCSYLNIRSSWLYSSQGSNFVKTILRLASEGRVKVVDDQIGRPTSCDHLVDITWKLLDQYGTWHVSDGGDPCSWYDFAKCIAIGKVDPCKSSTLDQETRRPTYSALCIENTQKTVGSFPSWKENLSKVLKEIEDNKDKE